MYEGHDLSLEVNGQLSGVGSLLPPVSARGQRQVASLSASTSTCSTKITFLRKYLFQLLLIEPGTIKYKRKINEIHGYWWVCSLRKEADIPTFSASVWLPVSTLDFYFYLLWFWLCIYVCAFVSYISAFPLTLYCQLNLSKGSGHQKHDFNELVYVLYRWSTDKCVVGLSIV